MARNEPHDVIAGDWKSECNMTLRGAGKRDKLCNKQLSAVGAAYEPFLLEEIDPAIPWLAKNKTKVCVNAGATRHGSQGRICGRDDCWSCIRRGTQDLPAPPTTKVGITVRGGYKAEFRFFLTGLDIEEKAKMVERQTLALTGEHTKWFSCLKFQIAGTVPRNPQSQDKATVDMRIFAQTQDPDLSSAGAFVDYDHGSFARFGIENLISRVYNGAGHASSDRTSIFRILGQFDASEIRYGNGTSPDGTVIAIPAPGLTKIRLQSAVIQHPQASRPLIIRSHHARTFRISRPRLLWRQVLELQSGGYLSDSKTITTGFEHC
ncbi:hypothetical protein BCR34DRAFT_603007 [Clohesyomyces aquaticus]|uniref:Acyclic terpene utilisation N-terminal domain-containing protein n=1 Tax=Clohesyomyces aquaticus TaxID=1231657 RepID=A0A1Y1ZG33_9PLEO|nr:hypothetical protein BCR34DRAFT_603007 [Clohesyomyces aquaticus]